MSIDHRSIDRLKDFRTCRKSGGQQLVAISYFLPIRQFLSPLVIFLNCHWLFTSESGNEAHTIDSTERNCSTELTACIGHQPIEIGAGLVLGTYALLIRKASLT